MGEQEEEGNCWQCLLATFLLKTPAPRWLVSAWYTRDKMTNITACKILCWTFEFFFRSRSVKNSALWMSHPQPWSQLLTMPPLLSSSVRQSVWFSLESGKDDKHILDCTGLSVRQGRKMRRNWEQFGEIVKPQLKSPGRPKKLSQRHHEALLEYWEERPTAYQDKMAWFLWDEFNLVVNESTVFRSSKEARIRDAEMEEWDIQWGDLLI